MNEYHFSDITLGMTEEFSSTITNEMMDHFLSISDDTNPLHIDVGYAQLKGFPSRLKNIL
jgi:3-hydroxybutyryl-CoA dehydratase